MNPLQDVFISYGRADSLGFAAKLNQRLVEMGLVVWFDFDDIPLGVDYQKQIDDGIDKADNFLFVIAPHSVNSPYCGLEVELAIQRNKRIIPLLHVEQIDRETWQGRNPNGTDEQWAEYQAAGKHSSFPNMHPLISKINWVYFREGQDDFEKSFQGLLEIFERDRDYVHEHTVLLNQAIDWEKDNRLPRSLLVDAELNKAEAWLTTKFSDHQSPCDPTRLHSEFITESLKFSQDGLTDVFICHAEEDRGVLDTIYGSLTRAAQTVWTSWKDIQTGVDYKESIDRGIEGASNMVYLLSPEALQSPWCQKEIDYALALNKRIIPLLVKPVDEAALSPELENLQFIDLTDNVEDADYLKDEADLIKVLSEEADYVSAHKRLLVKALKWERQLKNSSILLQGQALKQVDAWLQVAKTRQQYQPLPIQTEFVEASLTQPEDVRLSVFLSSDSRDLTFARKLHETLQLQGEHTWFESDPADLGADYALQVRAAIERAENFIMVVSQDGLAAPDVLEELGIAEQLSKRIIAVSYQSGAMSLVKQLHDKLSAQKTGHTLPELGRSRLPQSLLDSPWIDFSEHDGNFMSNFWGLYRILKSHPQHVLEHTRLLIRASDWEQANRDSSALLRTKEVTKAEQWLAQVGEQTPKPSELQKDYITASQDLAQRKVKPRTVIGAGFGVTLLILIARLFGLLEGLELAAYDHLLRQRAAEPQDDRFLVVTVDEKSGSFIRDGLISGRYQPTIGTLPDDALNEAIQVLNDNAARLIGLDFYRDFPATAELTQTFQQADNVVTVCLFGDTETPGVYAATEVAPEQVSFSNFVSDRPGGATYVRRHYLMDAPDPEYCSINTAFSLTLAQRFLEPEGITFQSPETPEGIYSGNGMQIGAVTVPNLRPARGIYYRDGDELNGYQTLVNFRTTPNADTGKAKDATAFAPQVSLEALLTGVVPSDLIRDRIVLIGYVDYADRNADSWETPHGTMPGVFVQGQMTSQLISATLDGRSLIHWWPFGQEALWILGWGLAGGFMARQTSRFRMLALGIGIGTGMLYVCCWGAMVFATLWIPFIPAFGAFALTAGGVALIGDRLRKP